MSKSIRMTRHELVWETRVAYFDDKRWQETLAWLKNFADKETDPYSWEGHWAVVYNRVKDMTFEDILADTEEYNNDTGNHIVFTFKNKTYQGEEWEYQDSLHDLLMEWLRDDCIESDVLDCNYADDSEEYIEIVED